MTSKNIQLQYSQKLKKKKKRSSSGENERIQKNVKHYHKCVIKSNCICGKWVFVDC